MTLPGPPSAVPAAGAPGTGALLTVDRLQTTVTAAGRTVAAVDGVSFDIRPGETLGLVGESGCGKSLTALSIVRLVEPPIRVAGGRVLFEGRDLLRLPEREMRRLRGARIGIVFQEPSTALNPLLTIGYQIAETLVVHGSTWPRARARAVELLAAVSVPDPRRRARDYPHQLSGGLRQRALIAAAIACGPPLLIADEPTTALDVTTQAEILELLASLKARSGLALLLITHDLAVVAQTADRVLVMYAGRIVEEAPVHALFGAPRHPYTQGLLVSLPGRGAGQRLDAIDGVVPPPGTLGRGCAFAPRCPHRFAPCTTDVPRLVQVGSGHAVRCYLYDGTSDGPGTRD